MIAIIYRSMRSYKNKFGIFTMILGCILCSAESADAQFQISAHGTLGVLFGGVRSYTNSGLGAGIGAQYLLQEYNLAFGINGDYLSFQAKDAFGRDGGGIYHSLIPVTAHVHYYFESPLEFVKPYAAFNIGIYNESVSANAIPFGRHAFVRQNKATLGVAPEAGLGLKLSDQVKFNLMAKYHLLFSGAIPTYFGDLQNININGTTFLTMAIGIAYNFPK